MELPSPSVAVAIATLSSPVDIRTLFRWLPWEELPPSVIAAMKESVNPKGMMRIPPLNRPGAIISLATIERTVSGTEVGQRRGIRLNVKQSLDSVEGLFNNCITLFMSAGAKNPCCKIYSTSIHVTGIRGVQEGVTTTSLILDHINRIQTKISYVLSHPELVRPALTAVCEACRGGEVHRVSGRDTREDGEAIKPDHLIKRNPPGVAPPGIDQTLYSFFLGYTKDNKFLSKFKEEFESRLRELTPVVSSFPVTLAGIKTVMVNYCYNLMKLPQYAGKDLVLIKYGLNDTLSRHPIQPSGSIYDVAHLYKNSYDKWVKIMFFYESSSSKSSVRPPRHSIRVNQKGVVNQSSPNQESAEEVFKMFMKFVELHGDKFIVNPSVASGE